MEHVPLRFYEQQWHGLLDNLRGYLFLLRRWGLVKGNQVALERIRARRAGG